MKRLDEHSQWENEWTAAFEDERQMPTEKVWSNLDAALANKEAKKYKKRAFYYQWLAAASVLFAVCGALLWSQNNSQGPFQQETAARTGTEVITEEPLRLSGSEKSQLKEGEGENKNRGGSAIEESAALAQNEQEIKSGTKQQASTQVEDKKVSGTAGLDEAGAGTAGLSGKQSGERQQGLAAVDKGENDATALLAENREERQGSLVLPGMEKKGFIEQAINTKVTANMQKVWLASDMLKKKEESAPKYLLGASLASNYFNPNYQDNNSLAVSMTESNALSPKKGQMSAARISEWDEVEEQNPITLNGGLQAAAWVGKRWVLQSGVQYGNYKSAGQAGSYVDPNNSQAYPLHYSNFSADKVQTMRTGARISAPVSVVNSFEFISVPVSIGYVVVDRKLGLMVSPGISSEFFLSNQLSGEGQSLSTYTTYGGEDSPYNRVHLRGLIGAQLYYKLGENYMISIEPSYQQSITDFNKSESYFDSRPTNMGLSAGFRYIIR